MVFCGHITLSRCGKIEKPTIPSALSPPDAAGSEEKLHRAVLVRVSRC
jgi:hypothetical protein